jgi:hypothetical protein
MAIMTKRTRPTKAKPRVANQVTVLTAEETQELFQKAFDRTHGELTKEKITSLMEEVNRRSGFMKQAINANRVRWWREHGITDEALCAFDAAVREYCKTYDERQAKVQMRIRDLQKFLSQGQPDGLDQSEAC